MEETIKIKSKLELDSFYTESEILKMGLKPLNVPKMNYIIYEDELNVYFFEQTEEDLYRLYCTSSKKSYYLS